MVDDAIHELENYLDKAMMSGYGEVNIIHGKGTGQLRKGIQEFLRTCPYIDSYRDADQNEVEWDVLWLDLSKDKLLISS